MLPDPLHPAVVHLPIALSVVIPGLAFLAMLLIRKQFLPVGSWGLIVLLQALLVGSAWLALESGENEEERVERVVAERYIESHEEEAERFALFAAIGLVLSAAGLLPRRAGSIGRAVAVAATFAVLAASIRVGHSGGELVYKHGAAAAYVKSPTAGRVSSAGHDRDD